MRNTHIGCLIALHSAALILSACGAVPPKPEPLTLAALVNAEYYSEFPKTGKAKLTDGLYQEDLAPGAASKLTIKLQDQQYALGDLNGDGTADAAVILAINSGGSGTFFYLAAVLNEGGHTQNSASASLGDRVQIKSVSIQSGVISVMLIRPGANDPLCCPTQPATAKFKLQAGKLVPID